MGCEQEGRCVRLATVLDRPFEGGRRIDPRVPRCLGAEEGNTVAIRNGTPTVKLLSASYPPHAMLCDARVGLQTPFLLCQAGLLNHSVQVLGWGDSKAGGARGPILSLAQLFMAVSYMGACFSLQCLWGRA